MWCSTRRRNVAAQDEQAAEVRAPEAEVVEGDAEDSDEEVAEEPQFKGKIGKKKMEKLRVKEEKRKMREAMQEMQPICVSILSSNRISNLISLLTLSLSS